MTWVVVLLIAWCVVPLPLAILVGRTLFRRDQRVHLDEISLQRGPARAGQEEVPFESREPGEATPA